MTGNQTSPAAAPAAAPKRPFLDVLLEYAGNPPLPEGYDTWGFKITCPDLRTYGGFRWPFPGGEVTDKYAVADGNPCPTDETGGFCIALDLQGAADGGYGYGPFLLLAYRKNEILGDSAHKLRVRHCKVVDLIDALQVYRNSQNADLQGANLQGANLRGADLRGADLQDASLRGAYLRCADLQDADLRYADLRGADLQGAYLQGAYLQGAYLQGADLQGAYLQGAYLQGADLQGAIGISNDKTLS